MLSIAYPVERTYQVDPICGMAVSAGTAVAEVEFIGVRYLFCCEECYLLFMQGATRHITELAHGGACIGHLCPFQRGDMHRPGA